MTAIKCGYNGKLLNIKIQVTHPAERAAELWIKQLGLVHNQKTLAYITLDELLNLGWEVREAIQKIVSASPDKTGKIDD
jgi:hypothetical protein